MDFSKILFIVLTVALYIEEIDNSKILGIFPLAAKSHYTLGNSLMRGLAEAGHDVTMMSPHNDENPVENGTYRNIVLTGFAEFYEATMKKLNPYERSYFSNSFNYLHKYQRATTVLMENIFQHPAVVDFSNSNETFDVVIVEQIACEALKYFAHHFKAHLVLFSSVAAESKVNYVMGNPTMVSFSPLIDTDFSNDMTLAQRIRNLLLYAYEAAEYKYLWLPFLDDLIQRYHPGAPSMFDINYNVSLVLVNSHESIQPSVPLVPNIVPIGGFHVEKAKRLPEDLENFLNLASDGVIYVSFGSTVRAENLPTHKKLVLLKTFGNLKQKILWKWEGHEVDDLPANVKTSKWFPQKDLLAHPNVRLFVTQGGLLSLTESISNGVPMLAVPILGDQFVNARMVETDGYGLSISFHDSNFSEEKLTSMIEELLHNSTFKEKAMEKSRIFHDREIDPLKKAVYWIEYVIRHKGAAHLKVWGVNLAWYQFYSLDVLFVILTCTVLLLAFLYGIVIALGKLFKMAVKTVIQKNKRNNKNDRRGNNKLKRH
ncbi:unnamed protein product [Phyllotreta striolata]|uniref:UDP-glucuronosyltransferase n=1 Tax=Phyllotreta striolata TaxID=444603 RepID=A0A9N9TLL6_PHYSR|nr:unnamed protein product [Phyllotreta striolata]